MVLCRVSAQPVDSAGTRGRFTKAGCWFPRSWNGLPRFRNHERRTSAATRATFIQRSSRLQALRLPDQPRLDGISLAALIDGTVETRGSPIGFWDYPARGIGVPSADWMGKLLKAQKAGGDLEPYEASRQAAELPKPCYPIGDYPGHAAWIDGDWKLHRIANDEGGATWELYDLATDPTEEDNLAEPERERVVRLRNDLEAWLESVVRSLNGEDYPRS